MKNRRQSTYRQYRHTAVAVFLFLLISLAGCETRQPELSDSWLIRVGSSVATVSQFNDTLRIAMVAYDRDALEEDTEFQTICKQVLSQMTDEMAILERARELDLRISTGELEHAVAEFKKDYPGEAFETLLIEHAVSAVQWEKGLHRSLLMEKVVERELYAAIDISPEDVTAYYNRHFVEKEGDKEPEAADRETINRRIVSQLRKEKAQGVFAAWMGALKKQYAIDINIGEWRKITTRTYQGNKKK